MTAVVAREQLRASTSGAARFTGADHKSEVSFFWVDAGAIVSVPAGTRHRFVSSGTKNLEVACIDASPTIVQDFVGKSTP